MQSSKFGIWLVVVFLLVFAQASLAESGEGSTEVDLSDASSSTSNSGEQNSNSNVTPPTAQQANQSSQGQQALQGTTGQNSSAAQVSGANGQTSFNPTSRANYINSVQNTLKAENALAQYLIQKKVEKGEVLKVIDKMAQSVDTTAGYGKKKTNAPGKLQNQKSSTGSQSISNNISQQNLSGRTGLSVLYVSETAPQANHLKDSILIDGDGNEISVRINEIEALEEEADKPGQLDQKLAQFTVSGSTARELSQAPAPIDIDSVEVSEATERAIASYPSRDLASEEDANEEDLLLEEDDGFIANLINKLFGEEEQTLSDAEIDAIEAEAAIEDYEPPFTIHAGKLKKKAKNKKHEESLSKDDPSDLIEIGTYTGNGIVELAEGGLKIAGKKVPVFVESIALKALESDQISFFLWAFIFFGIVLAIKLLFDMRAIEEHSARRNLGIVIPFRDALAKHHRPLNPEPQDWESRQAHVSVDEVSRVIRGEEVVKDDLEIMPEEGFNDSNWDKQTLITETTRVSGAIAPWTPKKQKILSPKKFYIQKDVKTNKWQLIQTDLNGKPARTIGEVASGTVVEGKILGKHFSAKRYKLNAQGAWYPTADRTKLILALDGDRKPPKGWM